MKTTEIPAGLQQECRPAQHRIRPSLISKGVDAPDQGSYRELQADFSWDAIRSELSGLPRGGLNIAYEAVDRHALGGLADHPALRCLTRTGAERVLTYGELARLTNKFANVLRGLGIGAGDRVFLLMPRLPELYVAALGALKNGSVVSPLFSAFGPEPIATRLRLGEGKVLVTTETLYRRKVEPIRASLPKLEHVVLVREEGALSAVPGTHDLPALMGTASEEFAIAPTEPDDMALLHFTSGTTGTPKGAIHVHRAVLMHYMTGTYALGLRPDDIFWCTADPGWVTGTSYGIVAPLVHGVTVLSMRLTSMPNAGTESWKSRR